MNRQRPLARRSQIRRAKRERALALERELRLAFTTTVRAVAGGACLMAGRGPACSGSLDAHHVTPKRALHRYARTLELDRESTASLLWDPNNGVAVCRRHHAEHETARRRIPRDLLPDRALAFARALELDYLIERTYPTTEGDRP